MRTRVKSYSAIHYCSWCHSLFSSKVFLFHQSLHDRALLWGGGINKCNIAEKPVATNTCSCLYACMHVCTWQSVSIYQVGLKDIDQAKAVVEIRDVTAVKDLLPNHTLDSDPLCDTTITLGKPKSVGSWFGRQRLKEAHCIICVSICPHNLAVQQKWPVKCTRFKERKISTNINLFD